MRKRPCSVWLLDTNNDAVDAYPFFKKNQIYFANMSLKVTSVATYCTVHSLSADVMADNMSSHQCARFRLTFSNRKKALFLWV